MSGLGGSYGAWLGDRMCRGPRWCLLCVLAGVADGALLIIRGVFMEIVPGGQGQV